jgi:DNA-binding response OmpR family regulator/cytochrome c peroxidase
MRVLLLEDQESLRSSTRKGLEEMGFVVDAVEDGDLALALAMETPFDALVLDIMVPGRDGLSILRVLREKKNATPVILLTARSTLPEKVEGLGLGADDYLTKPFYIEELVARLRTVVRRHSGASSHLLGLEDLKMDLFPRKASRGGAEIELSAREFQLLEFLMRTPGRVFSRVQIYEQVWGYGMDLESNLVEVYMQRLRAKIDKEHDKKLHLSRHRGGATTHSIDGDPVVANLKTGLASAFRVAGIETAAMPRLKNPPKPIDLPANPAGYPLTLPRHVPLPSLPMDNPLLVPRVALGERLFHETKLSRTHAISCASCHQGEEMSDPRRFSPGVDGEHGSRHSMPLFNLAWKSSFFWDGRAPSLREQALIPIVDPLEMDETLENVVAKLGADPAYPPLFRAAFGSGNITPEAIGLALENFLLTRVSFSSKFDRAFAEKETLTAQAKRGYELFFIESEPRMNRRGADCFHCHGGANFTDHSFHNNGIKPNDDWGLEVFTGLATDRHKFSTPSLRNISRTAPYMHDGRFATLEEVIEHYNAPPARSATLDPNLAKHPQGLGLNQEDQAALIEFLKVL